jgi:hypothetical protein
MSLLVLPLETVTSVFHSVTDLLSFSQTSREQHLFLGQDELWLVLCKLHQVSYQDKETEEKDRKNFETQGPSCSFWKKVFFVESKSKWLLAVSSICIWVLPEGPCRCREINSSRKDIA